MMYNKYEKLIAERGITSYQVSKETGLPQSMFSAWKKGTYNPKVDKLKRIAEKLGVPLEYFLEV